MGHKTEKTPVLSIVFLVLSIILCWFPLGTQPALASLPRSDAKEIKDRAAQAYRSQDYVRALELYTRAMDLARDSKDDKTYYSCVGNIGMIHDALQDPERALAYYNKALAGARKTGDGELEAHLLRSMVICCVNGGDVKSAKKYYEMQRRARFKDPVMQQYYLLLNDALIRQAEGNDREAIKAFSSLLKHIERNHLSVRQKVPVLQSLGEAWMNVEQYDSAMSYLSRGERLAEEEGLGAYSADICFALSKLYEKTGDTAGAYRYAARSKALTDSLYDSKRVRGAINGLLSAEETHASREISSLSGRVNVLLVASGVFALLVAALVVALVKIWRISKSRREAYKALVERQRELAEKDSENSLLRADYLRALENKEPAGEQDADFIKTQKLLGRITAVMENPGYLFNPEFNLTMLSREVGSNTKYVSAAINSTYRKSFRTLLNELRVKEAVRRLTATDVQIQDLACELGYGSAANFIRAFKAVTGMTPAVYRTTAASRQQE